MKKLWGLLLALVLCLGLAGAASADESGSCGENVTWKLEGGTLTISGSRTMTDYLKSEQVPGMGCVAVSRTLLSKMALPVLAIMHFLAAAPSPASAFRTA